MKKILLLFLVLFYTVSTWAARRTAEEAFDIACSFFARNAVTRSADEVKLVAVSGELLNAGGVTRTAPGESSFYIYNKGVDAYVIVSGDDRMKPVLGYSDNGAFVVAGIPSNIQAWLAEYDAQYASLNEGGQRRKEPFLMTRAAALPESVAPLLKDISWNQDEPYNNACPQMGTGRAMTGCVATAMAMVMKYHNYPEKGIGTHTYKAADGKEYSFDFENATFDWQNMLPQYIQGNYTTVQASAVAKLMYACGVSVDMGYGANASGAYSYRVGQALIDYFGYDEGIGYVCRDYFTSKEWMNMIKTELSEGRPVFYNGASKDVGHAFVFDGYDAQEMVHVNWGWGGANNGYFEVATLNPDTPGIGGGTNLGGGFTMQQGMVIGVQPPTASPLYTSHFFLTEVTSDKNNFAKGEAFNLSVAGIYNMTTKFKGGSLGVIAEKDGKQTALWSVALEDVNTNYGYRSFSCNGITVPAALADGTYALYLATKDNRESAWSRVRGGYGAEAQFMLAVTGNNCVLNPFAGALDVENDLDGTVKVLHNLYKGHKGDFLMTLSNSNASNEFYGLAGVVFLKEGTDAQLQFVGLAGYTQLTLNPNTVGKEFAISGDLTTNLQETETDIAAGDYFICAGVQWGNYIFALGEELVPVTVKQAFGSPDLNVMDIALEKDKIEVGEKLKLTAKLSLKGTGVVYDKTLMAAIFPAAGGSTSNLHYAEVFVEKGESQDFEMLIDPQVGVGNYFICLYKPTLLGQYDGSNPLCRINFSVSPYTSIEEERAGQAGVKIYQHPSEEVLRVCTDSEVYMISLYNLAGQQVICNQVSESSREYSVPVNGLSSGCYIVVVRLADGTVHRSKFIKR
ncbi:MAG: thiol protease/hemagglutinin PrtT [Bacteroides sp.]|nr:thiol protease/hemagglutinin PrtT [Bacteroides sp.]